MGRSRPLEVTNGGRFVSVVNNARRCELLAGQRGELNCLENSATASKAAPVELILNSKWNRS